MIRGCAAKRAPDHTRPVSRRLPFHRRSPARQNTESRPTRAKWRAPYAPLQPMCTMLARSREFVYRHVPDEPSGGRQRNPTRSSIRQRGAHGAPRRLSARALRLHRPVRRPSRRGRTRRLAHDIFRRHSAGVRLRTVHTRTTRGMDHVPARAWLRCADECPSSAHIGTRSPSRVRAVSVSYRPFPRVA